MALTAGFDAAQPANFEKMRTETSTVNSAEPRSQSPNWQYGCAHSLERRRQELINFYASPSDDL